MEEWRKEKIRKKRKEQRDSSLPAMDVSFLLDLDKLAVTLRNLVEREGGKTFGTDFITADIAMILRQVLASFALLRFVNADDRRDFDPDYRLAYSFVILPVVRTMIDGFYNITTLLDDPSTARLFRRSGYKRLFAALDQDEILHGNDPKWIEWIKVQRNELTTECAIIGMSRVEISKKGDWPLLGKYLSVAPVGTPHKLFLQRFTIGIWREYSEISHATFRGLKTIFPYISIDRLPRDKWDLIKDRAELQISLHVGRAAGLQIALLTEVQSKFKFKGHNVNARIHAMWRALLPIPEVKELYDSRYKTLMEQNGIVDVASYPT
jgi:hypothetical protein